MGKIVHIKKARKEHKCSKCGKVIVVGEPYKKGVLNFHKDIIVCNDCTLKSYEVTTSEYSKSIGAICEDWGNDFGNCETTPDEIASALEELRDEVESNLENMPENLKENSPTGELLQNRLKQLEDAIERLRDIDIESLRSEAEEEAQQDNNEDDFETKSEYEEAVEATTDEVFEERLSNAIDEALSSLEY